MANVATVTAPSGFLLTRPRAQSAGALETLSTTTARGPQLYSRLQTIQDTLLPPNSGYWSTNLATNTLIGGGFSLAIGGYVGLLTGIYAWTQHKPEALIVPGGFLAIAATCGALALIGRDRHARALGKKGDEQATQITDLVSAFAKLPELERDVVAYRAHCLMRDLRYARADSPKLREQLAPMIEAYEALPLDRKETVIDIAAIVDSIMLPTGELAPSARDETEYIIRRIESVAPETREVVANLVRGAVQVDVDTNDGHRWRLRRLLEALDGQRVPYAAEGPSEVESSAPPSAASNQKITLDRCVTLLRGGLAVERAEDDPMRAHTKIIPSTNPALAEQTAAYFERAGYRAAIYDDGNRLVVSVFNPTDPPWGAFVRGVAS
jgi:hypothetical protein